MPECEDCGDYVPRRTRCADCGFLICRWCYHHAHGVDEFEEYHSMDFEGIHLTPDVIAQVLSDDGEEA